MPSDARQPSIPRVLHWLWLGPSAVPDLFRHYTDSWRRHHPDWETRLWRDETLPALACQAEYEAATAFKTRYDIVRLELLRQFGGVIVDMDVEAIRPLDPLLRDVRAFAGAMEGGHVGNQVLGAEPRHPFFEHAVARLPATVIPDNSSARAVGKVFLRQMLAERPDGITLFPSETFHYQPSFDPPRRPADFPNVYAVHHELASYAVPPAPGQVEEVARRLVAEAEALADAAEDAGAATVAEARQRIDKAGRRLVRALRHQTQGYGAVVRRVEAERQQALVQLDEARRRLEAFAQES
jgi:hypothetical protein